MELKKCENCGDSFEGQENQLYCSNKCKQQAYNRRKEQSKEARQIRISLEEYEQILKTDAGKELENNFMLFCFLRKNVPEKISLERLQIFLKNNLEDYVYITSPERGKGYPAWENFKQAFLNSEIEIVETY